MLDMRFGGGNNIVESYVRPSYGSTTLTVDSSSHVQCSARLRRGGEPLTSGIF